VASEGKLLAFTPAAEADSVLAAMRELAHGLQARLIGRCVADHGGMVVARTALGARLVIDMAIGEQLPRIC
jgi:hydrogenase expression/formation protein HypE